MPSATIVSSMSMLQPTTPYVVVHLSPGWPPGADPVISVPRGTTSAFDLKAKPNSIERK